ncbi:DegV family protein [Secundilactobacillus oryzae JCM 18671]|uniref:DegV family protein n=1 Tax=Secundilactobacillus oryzae JCM 18671 TaxID=1291743 RepID=A0A081BGZ3_9LACO|nr:DegV family protein [Secundilactobacillus oryzae]GAK47311.1 DegV family protein [Secundilactobacillus oryzae JCM 18671]
MATFQLLTDSAVDLPFSVLREHNVDFVSMHIHVNGQDIPDDLGEQFDLDDFYQTLKNGTMPSTAQVNIGQFVAFFEPYVKRNIPILYVGFSSGLSGTFNNARLARNLLRKEYPKAKIYLVDTLAASGGEGLILLDAIDKRDNGMGCAELTDWLVTHRLRYRQWFTVNDLNFLYHGGRVSRSSATIGSLLQIKPIMDVDQHGNLRVISKARSRRRSLIELANHTVKTLANPDNPRILITASQAEKAANEVADHIRRQVPNANILIEKLGPTIASHTGLGCVAVFSMGKENRQ